MGLSIVAGYGGTGFRLGPAFWSTATGPIMVVYMAEDFARAKVERTVSAHRRGRGNRDDPAGPALVEVAGEAAAVGIGSFVADNPRCSSVSAFRSWSFSCSGQHIDPSTWVWSSKVPALGLLNLVWLLGIVFLPFPTAIVGHDASTSSTCCTWGRCWCSPW